MPRTLALTWLDLLIAGLLIVCGAGAWGVADTLVSSALREQAPDKAEYLARPPVRWLELRLKTAESELDATREKSIEQRLAGTPDVLSSKLPALAAALLESEIAVAEVRRDATREFERDDRRFRLKQRTYTLALGVAVAAAFFAIAWIAGLIVAPMLKLTPAWPVAFALATTILALLFGYETAGVAGAGVAAAVATIVVLRP